MKLQSNIEIIIQTYLCLCNKETPSNFGVTITAWNLAPQPSDKSCTD